MLRKNFLACPLGFTPYEGNEAGSILEISENDISLNECANKCNAKRECNSFTHSVTSKKCKLMDGKRPSDTKIKDYQFCSKNAGNIMAIVMENNTFLNVLTL